MAITDSSTRPAAPRVALYARVSTTGKGQDVALQLNELRAVAAQRGWRVVEEFTDEGVSGARERRPALDRLMAEAKRRRFDIVAVWRFDRFARSTRHLVQALEEFRGLGIEFLSLREAIDTATPMGRAMFTIAAAFSELEREIIRERVQAGVDRARARGKRLGRPPKAVHDPAAVIVLLGAGSSCREVSRQLSVPLTTVRRIAKTLRQIPPAGGLHDQLRDGVADLENTGAAIR